MITIENNSKALFLLFIGLALSGLTATNADFALPVLVDAAIIIFCFAALQQVRQRIPTNYIRYFAAGLVLLVFLTVRSFYSLQSDTHFDSMLCQRMPAIFPKLECFYMMSFFNHHGFRQIFFHFVALLIAFTSFQIFRSHCEERHKIALLGLFPMVCSIWVLLENFGIVEHSMVGENFVFARNTVKVGNTIFSNYGWFWPFLAPAVALFAAFFMIVPRLSRGFLWLIGLMVLLSGALATGQRGAYLISALVFIILATHGLYIVVSRKRFGVFNGWIIAVVGACVICLATWHAFMSGMVGDVLHAIGFDVKENYFAHSGGRIEIWRVALLGIEKNLWIGTGHSTWMRSYVNLQKQYGLGEGALLPTAHNFFIQTIFELGIIHAAAVFLWLLWPLKRAIESKSRFAIIVATQFYLMAFCVAAVQEMDHVNTVYYQFSWVFGVVLGAGAQNSSFLSKRVSRRSGMLLILLGAIWGLLFLQLSWGGYSFDVIRKTGSSHKRKFRPWGVIANFRANSQLHYSLYEQTEITSPIKVLYPFRMKKDVVFEGKKWMVMRNLENSFLGEPVFYSSPLRKPESQKMVAFELNLPPYQTNLNPLESKGDWRWEKVASNQEAKIFCNSSCEFVFENPGCKRQFFVLTKSQDSFVADVKLGGKKINDTDAGDWGLKFDISNSEAPLFLEVKGAAIIDLDCD